MKVNELNINKRKSSKSVCFGTGLIALDVILNGNPNTQPKFQTGGSCGNVLTILAFFGWKSYPIARLSDNYPAQLLFDDLKNHKVKLDLISQLEDGSTPIIIHKILKDLENNPKHRFEFRVPKTNTWFPSYKPVLSNKVKEITTHKLIPKVFYFDRVSRATIDLAKHYKTNGSLIFFEPSSIGTDTHFKECLTLADILKFSNDRLPQYKGTYLTRQVPIEIETLGANGLLYRSFKNKTEEWHFLPAIHIEDAKDTAGAGDWCSSGIIHSLTDEKSNTLKNLSIAKLQQALEFGQFLGALNCFFYGARGLMYNLSYLEIQRVYKIYLNSKEISINKSDPGFTINESPYNFSELL